MNGIVDNLSSRHGISNTKQIVVSYSYDGLKYIGVLLFRPIIVLVFAYLFKACTVA
jgi:hypothetical protein